MPNDDTMNNYVFDPALSEIEIQEIKQKAANNITFLNTDPKPYALSVGFLAGAGVAAGGCISYYTSSYDFNRNLDIAFGAVVWAAAGGVIGVVGSNIYECRKKRNEYVIKEMEYELSNKNESVKGRNESQFNNGFLNNKEETNEIELTSQSSISSVDGNPNFLYNSKINKGEPQEDQNIRNISYQRS